MNVGEITATVRATADAFKATINAVKKDIQEVAKETQEQAKKASNAANEIAKGSKQVADGAKEVQAKLTSISIAASATFYGMIRGIGDVATVTNKFNNSLLGVKSTAQNMRIDLQATTKAAQDLSADGLMTVSQSSTGLKNLLLSGFGLKESINLMNGFKDSAAFGRQASLEFGEAIDTATEGIKNGNSILVDNAGVTKNLSVMLKEAGYSEQDLMKASTDSGVRMALYNGILKETAHQTGDAAKLAGTLSGQMSQFSTQANLAKVSVGNALTPSLQELYSVLSVVTKGVTDLTNAQPGFVSGIIKITVSVMGLIALFTALSIIIPKINDGIKLLNTTLIKSPWGWLALAIGAVIAVIYKLIAANQEAKKVQEEYNKAVEEHNKLVQNGIDKSQIPQVQEEIDKLKDLSKQYDDLNKKMTESTKSTSGVNGSNSSAVAYSMKEQSMETYKYGEQLKKLHNQMAQYGADETTITRMIKEKEEAIKEANKTTVEEYNNQAKSIAQKYSDIMASQALIDTYKNAEKGSSQYREAEQKLAEIFPQYSSASGIAIDAIQNVTTAQEKAAKAEFSLMQTKARLQKIDVDNTIKSEQLKIDAMRATISAMVGEDATMNAMIGQKVAQFRAAQEKLNALRDESKALGDIAGVKIENVKGITPLTPKDNLNGNTNTALNNALEIYEYRKHLNQLTLEDEVKTLESIKSKYAKTAEEKRDLDMRIYDVKQEISQKEIEASQKVYDTAKSNIENLKYYNQLSLDDELKAWEKLRDQYAKDSEFYKEADKEVYRVRQELLDKSVEAAKSAADTIYNNEIDDIQKTSDALEEAYNKRVDQINNEKQARLDAIDEQIKALDELTKTEDRKKQDDQDNADIASLQDQINRSQDPLEKFSLEQQLKKKQDEVNERHKQEAREDEKQRLQDMKEYINEEANIKLEQAKALYEIEKNSLEKRKYIAEQTHIQMLDNASKFAADNIDIYSKNQNDIIAMLQSKSGIYYDSAATLGEMFAKGLEDQSDRVKQAANKLALAASNVLELHSPAKEGPLSTLNTWWKAFMPTLLQGMDISVLKNMVTRYIQAPSSYTFVSDGTKGNVQSKGNTYIDKLYVMADDVLQYANVMDGLEMAINKRV